MNDSFEDVKVGDVIIVSTNQGERVATVGRITAKQFVTRAGHKFWKKNGLGVGCDVWQSRHALKPKLGQIELCRKVREKRDLVEKIKRCSLTWLDLEQLKRLDAILDEANK